MYKCFFGKKNPFFVFGIVGFSKINDLRNNSFFTLAYCIIIKSA